MSKSFGSSSFRPCRIRITRSTSAIASSWRTPSRGTIDPHRIQAEHALIRGIRNDDEVVLTEVEAAGRRPLVEHADHFEPFVADADQLAERIESAGREQQLVGRIAEHDDVLPVLD